MQKVVSRDGYPLSRETTNSTRTSVAGRVRVLYAMGCGLMWRGGCAETGFEERRVKETPVWSAIPSVTATGNFRGDTGCVCIVGQEGNADSSRA